MQLLRNFHLKIMAMLWKKNTRVGKNFKIGQRRIKVQDSFILITYPHPTILLKANTFFFSGGSDGGHLMSLPVAELNGDLL